jgi:hypothetical protein
MELRPVARGSEVAQILGQKADGGHGGVKSGCTDF